MLMNTVLMIMASYAPAGLAFVNHFKIEEPAETPHQNTVEYPESPKVALLDTPPRGAQYKLSYADYHVTWENFKITHSKQYASTEEERSRYRIFMENVNFIEHHNWKYHNGHSSFYLDINHLADLTEEEYLAMNGYRADSKDYTACPDYIPTTTEVPESVDWKKEGYVTPAKNQGSCGSCWAYVTTGAVEAQWFKKTGNLVSLSEQQLLDCCRGYDNDGCLGGFPDMAFQYIRDVGGIEPETAYPYEEKVNACRLDSNKVVAKISSCFDVVPRGSEDALKVAVGNIGPVTVAIDSSGPMFQFYSGGVYDNPECSNTTVNHGVLAVGYGNLDGNDFWFVKNSWGKYWGEEGFGYMSRNKDNQCGIALQASFPQV